MRQDRARATRRAIVEAAGRLFVERGYVATSADDIAAAAGVGRATVFNSVGGKPELLKEAYRLAVRGGDPETPLGAQARAREILADPDPRRLLDGYASVCAEFAPRLAPLYEAVRAAAHANDEAAGLWQLLSDERHGGTARVIDALRERGALQDGLDRRTATDVLWVLNDPGLYYQLVVRRHWSQRRFRRWLSDSMQSQLIRPEHEL